MFVVAAVWMVMTKRPWIDEAWFSSPAWELVTYGRMGTALLDPAGSHLRLYNPHAVLQGINQHTYWVMPLHLLELAAWGKIFGFSVFSMRIPAILWGLVALASVGQIVRRLYGGKWAAEIAMAALALDFGFLDSASDARMDMMCAALGFAALAIYLHWRETSFRRALLVSNTLAAAACFTHPNGSFAAVALVAAMLYLDRKRWREMNPGLVFLPYAAGGLGWWLYASQAPADFAAQFSANAAGRMSDLLSPWRGIWREITGRLMIHYWPEGSWSGKLKITGLLLFLSAGGMVAGLRKLRSSSGAMLLVLLTLLRFFLLSIAANGKFTYYMVHLVPYFAMLVGIAGSYALTNRSGLFRLSAAVALVAYFAVQGAALWHRTVTVNGYAREYQPLVASLNAIARPGEEIVGGAELGFALGFDNRHLADDVWLGYWSRRSPTVVVIDRWYYQEVIDTASRRGFPAPDYFGRLLSDDYYLTKELQGYKIYRRRTQAGAAAIPPHPPAGSAWQAGNHMILLRNSDVHSRMRAR